MHYPLNRLPSYYIPAIDDLRHAREQLGVQLRAGFAAAGMTDPAAIGHAVANAQQYNPREDIPFHAAVVQSWFSGQLLPSDETLEAIHSMLEDKTDQHWRDHTDALLDAATFNPVETLPIYIGQVSQSLRLPRQQLSREIAAHSKGAYKPCTIDQILNGKSILSNSTALYASMKRTLRAHGLNTYEAETISHDAVALAQLNMALPCSSELMETFRAYCLESGLGTAELARALSPPAHPSAISMWRNGREPIPLHRLAAMDEAFARHHVSLQPPLMLLQQMQQRLKAEEMWLDAATNSDFGMMLEAARYNLGCSQPRMIEYLQENGTEKITPAGLFQWEKNTNLPSYKKFPQDDIVTTYGRILSNHDAQQDKRLARNHGPFWTPDRDTAMRMAFTQAAERRTNIGTTRDDVYRERSR